MVPVIRIAVKQSQQPWMGLSWGFLWMSHLILIPKGCQSQQPSLACMWLKVQSTPNIVQNLIPTCNKERYNLDSLFHFTAPNLLALSCKRLWLILSYLFLPKKQPLNNVTSNTLIIEIINPGPTGAILLGICRQCRSRSAGFFRSQLIRIYTVHLSELHFIEIIWMNSQRGWKFITTEIYLTE